MGLGGGGARCRRQARRSWSSWRTLARAGSGASAGQAARGRAACAEAHGAVTALEGSIQLSSIKKPVPSIKTTFILIIHNPLLVPLPSIKQQVSSIKQQVSSISSPFGAIAPFHGLDRGSKHTCARL